MKGELGISIGQIEVNWNEAVYVRLTREGRVRVSATLPEELAKAHLITDEGGWSKFQLWSLMNMFGDMLHMGNNELPFEGGIIKFGEKIEKKVQITSG